MNRAINLLPQDLHEVDVTVQYEDDMNVFVSSMTQFLQLTNHKRRAIYSMYACFNNSEAFMTN